MNGDDADTIRKATEDLGQTIQKIGTAAYQAQGPAAGGPAGPTGPTGPENGGQGPASGPGGEDVVDGEFKSV
jgi:hypothetical protein